MMCVIISSACNTNVLLHRLARYYRPQPKLAVFTSRIFVADQAISTVLHVFSGVHLLANSGNLITLAHKRDHILRQRTRDRIKSAECHFLIVLT